MQSTLKKLPSIAFASLLVFFGSILTASAQTLSPLEYTEFSDIINMNVESAEYWWLSYDINGEVFNGNNTNRSCPVAGFCDSENDGLISGENYGDFHVLYLNTYSWNYCQSQNYETCIASTTLTIYDDFLIEYVAAPTSTPLTEDKRVDNLLLFVLFWFTTFGGTVILVNKFT